MKYPRVRRVENGVTIVGTLFGNVVYMIDPARFEPLMQTDNDLGRAANWEQFGAFGPEEFPPHIPEREYRDRTAVVADGWEIEDGK